ncbi:hypothetical protein EVA_18637 [gut metagenome]|uniref:Uncharacterized protein n=1 Tax=gut metagenome TaxID=749906 RepID=J9FEB4_9ZZZZ
MWIYFPLSLNIARKVVTLAVENLNARVIIIMSCFYFALSFT